MESDEVTVTVTLKDGAARIIIPEEIGLLTFPLSLEDIKDEL